MIYDSGKWGREGSKEKAVVPIVIRSSELKAWLARAHCGSCSSAIESASIGTNTPEDDCSTLTSTRSSSCTSRSPYRSGTPRARSRSWKGHADGADQLSLPE